MLRQAGGDAGGDENGVDGMNSKTDLSAPSRPRRILRGVGIVLACLLAILILSVIIAVRMAFNTGGVPAGAIQKTTTSQDGTSIAYEQTGNGPVLILVASALADREGARRLGKELAKDFTVVNYDRRGRGKSGDSPRYAREREVEDIEALVQSSGGPVFLFGSSSGAALALDAANQIGPKVKGLFMYEPPFIVDDSRPPMPANLSNQIAECASRGRRDEAVELFFMKGVGIPRFGVTMTRLLMPGWSKMTEMAQTIPYDLAILEGTQSGKPLPAGRWSSTTVPTLVMVGERSEPFFHSGGKAIAEVLHNAECRSLPGGTHGALLFSPRALATEVERFFLSIEPSRR